MWCRRRRMLRGMRRWPARPARSWRRAMTFGSSPWRCPEWSGRQLSREVSSVFRVTISAGPYVIRDMPAIVSVDGVPVGIGAESVDLASLVLCTYDDVSSPTVPRSGCPTVFRVRPDRLVDDARGGPVSARGRLVCSTWCGVAATVALGSRDGRTGHAPTRRHPAPRVRVAARSAGFPTRAITVPNASPSRSTTTATRRSTRRRLPRPDRDPGQRALPDRALGRAVPAGRPAARPALHLLPGHPVVRWLALHRRDADDPELPGLQLPGREPGQLGLHRGLGQRQRDQRS